jgi:hypothetical protein
MLLASKSILKASRVTKSATASTRFRTCALVAGLTGLLIALGAVGGTILWLFAALALIFTLVGSLLRPDAQRVARAQPLSEDHATDVDAVIRQRRGGVHGFRSRGCSWCRVSSQTRSGPAETHTTRRSRRPRDS